MTEPTITLSTLRMFQEYHWLMLRVFYDASVARFGDEGIEAVRRGVHACGVYRGQRMHDKEAALLSERNALLLVEEWDTGEWELASIDGDLTVHGDASDLTLQLAKAPGSDYFADRGPSTDALDLYWPAFMAGVAEGFGPGVVATVGNGPDGSWHTRIVVEGVEPVSRALVLGTTANDELTLLRLSRNTSGLIAALQMYVSRELVRRFDADGEDVVREASYEFGASRGGAMRVKHEREGIPITLASFASSAGLQERDPSEAVFVFRERQHVSAGAYYLDCTYCPLQEVWAQEGAEGLRLGYLFDASNHRGLFQSYHPETVVRWDSVKTRGDSVCKFRFTVPSLMTADDPTPEEFDEIR